MADGRIYIGRLSYDVRERDLERFVKKYGRIREIMMKNGYAFVDFEDGRDADDAVYELNGRVLLGERVRVEHARGTPRGSDMRRDEERGILYRNNRERRSPERTSSTSRTEYRVIVENLSSRVSWQDLKDMMRQVGEVTYADAHREKKNQGVVEFASYRDMKKAIEKLDGTDVNGRKIKVTAASRGRSRSRSRSGRRSESRSPVKSKSRSRSGSRDDDRRNSGSARNDIRNDKKRSLSRSRSNDRNGSESPVKKSRARSRSHSSKRSRSESPINKRRSVSGSPRD